MKGLLRALHLHAEARLKGGCWRGPPIVRRGGVNGCEVHHARKGVAAYSSWRRNPPPRPQARRKGGGGRGLGEEEEGEH